jgi:signal transduction histidine kinase
MDDTYLGGTTAGFVRDMRVTLVRIKAYAQTMSAGNNNAFASLGLQCKSALILAFVVTAVTVAGGWFYYGAASQSLRAGDRKQADRLAQALAMSAAHDLRHGQDRNLQRLVSDFVRHDNVQAAALLNARGELVAQTCRGVADARWDATVAAPLAVSSIVEDTPERLLVAQPVVMDDTVWFEQRLVGALRIAFDTAPAAARRRTVLYQIAAAAGVIVFAGIPMGYLLVWRFIVRPVRELSAVAVRLGRGDFAARAPVANRDEVGRLGAAFNAMADDVAAMRDQLVQANGDLERKIAQRTAELEVANRRLRQETAEKNEFLRAVSHDLNAPLRNIGGIATLILMKWRDELPEDVVGRLRRIQVNVDVQTSQLCELLELSRIQTRPQRRGLVDMGELIASVAATFEHELGARGIELTVAGDLPRLYVEPARVRQAFQNLIDNAIKYMNRPAGGRISIDYRLADDAHEFIVADNGPGIAPDQIERVFCVFRRGRDPVTARVPGKGVGLAVVRSVAACHDGLAWAVSAPGQGTDFHVTFHVRNTQPPEGGQEHMRADEDLQAAGHPAGR